MHQFVAASLQSSLLQWIVCECPYLEEGIKFMYEIISIFNSDNVCFATKNKEVTSFLQQFPTILSSNRDIFLNLQVCRIIESGEEYELLNWLKNVDVLPDHFCDEIYHFLCGLLTLKHLEPAVFGNILRITLDYVSRNAPLSQKLLMIILSRIANETQPELRFSLLQSLPKMVIYRDNIGRIMGFLQTISKGSHDLFNLGLSLMYEAWKVDNKCYSYLEDMLVVDCFPTRRWEFYVNKAHVIKELCQRKYVLFLSSMNTLSVPVKIIILS